jgi:hypothetical protein
VRVTVIATGFAGGGPQAAVPRFEPAEREREWPQPRTPRREEPARPRPPIFDQGSRSSLEIDEDEIDVPPFLKDT